MGKGWIQFFESGPSGDEPEDLRFAHTWVVAEGKVIDLALVQFGVYLEECEYRRAVKGAVSAEKYLQDGTLNTDHPEIF